MILAASSTLNGVCVVTNTKSRTYIPFHTHSMADDYMDFSIETESIPYVKKARVRIKWMALSERKRNKWCKYRHKEGLRYKEIARMIPEIEEEEEEDEA